MSTSQPEVSSMPCVFASDSSTPLLSGSPIFVSCDNTGNDACPLESGGGPVTEGTEQVPTRDTTIQQGEENEGGGQFQVPKKNKTSEA